MAAIDAYAATGKPCLIGEFSFRGADSGLPNTNGAGPVVATQGRARRLLPALRHRGAAKPTLVGYHWFEHADQPAEGRFDGENSNFGTVTINDVSTKNSRAQWQRSMPRRKICMPRRRQSERQQETA